MRMTPTEKLTRRAPGFTLIEILIAISIVAVIATITVAVLNPQKRLQQSRDAVRWEDIQAINKAVALYRIDQGGQDVASIPPFSSLTTDVPYMIGTCTGATTPTCAAASPPFDAVIGATNGVDLSALATGPTAYFASLPVSPGGVGSWNQIATGYYLMCSASGRITVGALESEEASVIVLGTPPVIPPPAGTIPILIVTNIAANPFTGYLQEILLTEGLNAFATADIGTVTAAVLASYDVVVLGEMTLSVLQVTMFTDWVTAGGELIAMRPDSQFAGLLGLNAPAGTRQNAYLLINTAASPGQGLVNQTIQYHGIADNYTLNGATAVATIYSDAINATANPAVTLRTVNAGTGGQAAAFTYDLARSVAQTRQGNPAWAGQDRSEDPDAAPVRPIDLFYGNSINTPQDPQTDWIDVSKIPIPQADEQMRLLANLILHMQSDTRPFPRFWYFPRDEKAAVVMTGDDHDAVGGNNNGTQGRLISYQNQSIPGCVVSNWDCIRSTSYIYTNAITPAQASAHVTNGFEIALHTYTDTNGSVCANFQPVGATNLATAFPPQLSSFNAAYNPGVPAPRTVRTHCGPWSDYSTHASVGAANGLRFDTDYYHWFPIVGQWILQQVGFFNGSGMPMRFATAAGSVIDAYQAPTQMQDESGTQSYPATVDTLLDRAIGIEGYYGFFVVNAHTDNTASAVSDAVIASAVARGVPIISSAQALDWTDGRNSSTITNLGWNGTQASFTVTADSKANGLQAMMPSTFNGVAVAAITRDGSPITLRTETMIGRQY